MDYRNMSDGEISVRLARLLKPKFGAVISPYDKSGAQLSWALFNTMQTTGYFPLSRAEHLFPVMKKHRVGLAPSGKTIWQASHESGISATHRNPLRAVAIVYLTLQEPANVQGNPA